MNSLDDSILEFLYEVGGEPSVALPPTVIWWNLVEDREVSESVSSTFSRRMNKLAEAGLLEQVDESRGYYKLTQLGKSYLEEEMTDEEHQQLQDSVEE